MPPPLLPRLLERLPELADFEAVPSEWHHHLGADCFTGLPAGYLLNTRTHAATVPCRHSKRSCRRHHRIEEVGNDRLIAYCQNGEDCPPFEIMAADRLVWRIDLAALLADIASTLTLDGPPEAVAPACWRLGTATKRRIPVFVSFATDVQGHAQNVAFVAAQKHERPVFFVPTAASAVHPVEAALKQAGGRLGVLADFLEIDRKGRLAAALELSERWSDLDREPNRATEKLPLPTGATWAQIVVTLLANGKINISHTNGDPQRTYTRAELQFETLAGGDSKDWAMLKVIADQGCIPIRPQSGGRRDENAHNRAKGITKKLQLALRIDGQAFQKSDTPLHKGSPRSRITGYWPLLKIRHESDRVVPKLGNYPTDVDDLPSASADPPEDE